MKICKKCKHSKTVDNFTYCPSTKDKLRNWCKECFRIYDLERAKTLTPEYKSGRTLVRYWPELSPLEALNKYNELLIRQNGFCAICNSSAKENRRLCVDHCHETNKVRGILCDDCNTGIGKLKDIINLEKAIQYLKDSNENI